MITTIVGKINSIGKGRYTNGSNTPVIDFTMSVDRGNAQKRKSLLNGQEYSVDFYKVTLFGQSALSFAQYAKEGRLIEVSGRLLQEEYWSTKPQTAVITPDNPLFGYFAQLVGKISAEAIGSDGTNIFIKAHTQVNRTNMTCMEYRWRESNPNSTGAEGFGGFQPQTNGFNAQGFGGTSQAFGGATNAGFGTQTPEFGGAPMQSPTMPQTQNFGGFQTGAVAQVPGFTQAPAQNQGFGVGFPNQSQTPAVGFTQQANPQTPASFPGFGGQSTQPVGFENTGGFGTFQPQVAEQATVSDVPVNFTPQTNEVTNGFTTESNPTGAVETNIPTPEKTAEPVATEETEKKEINQGF